MHLSDIDYKLDTMRNIEGESDGRNNVICQTLEYGLYMIVYVCFVVMCVSLPLFKEIIIYDDKSLFRPN